MSQMHLGDNERVLPFEKLNDKEAAVVRRFVCGMIDEGESFNRITARSFAVHIDGHPAASIGIGLDEGCLCVKSTPATAPVILYLSELFNMPEWRPTVVIETIEMGSGDWARHRSRSKIIYLDGLEVKWEWTVMVTPLSLLAQRATLRAEMGTPNDVAADADRS